MMQGPADAVARLHAWLHQGPPAARVVRVTQAPLPPAHALVGFERRPSA
jgi:acylphosphatase